MFENKKNIFFRLLPAQFQYLIRENFKPNVSPAANNPGPIPHMNGKKKN